MKDYGELVVTASQISGDVDAANYAGSLVGILEQKLARKLKVPQALVAMNIASDSDGIIELPDDYVHVKSVTAGNITLNQTSLTALTIQNQDGYVLIGDEIRSSAKGKDHTVLYYRRLPSLQDNQTNWLLKAAPDIYLQGLLLELFIKNQDIEKAAITRAYLDSLVSTFISETRGAAIPTTTP